jgi:hypothetical protein
METWKLCRELEQVYRYHSFECIKHITSDDFQYISDYEEDSLLNKQQYEEHLRNQLKDFKHPNSLAILESHCNKNMIEIVLQKDMNAFDSGVRFKRENYYPFWEPCLLQCQIEHGKITKMILCSLQEKKIPDNIQQDLLESCKRNDFNAAKEAIEKGAYAQNCMDKNGRMCISYAAEYGGVDLCNLLIEDDAGIHWDVVFFALKNPNIEVLKYFLQLNVKTDVVTRFEDNFHPMTPLDYARFLHNQSAEKLLLESKAPTLEELKEWCFQTSKFKIRLSEKHMDGGDMSISAVGDEIDDFVGMHYGKSTMCLWMEHQDCCNLIVGFFLPFFKEKFETYCEDNLVSLDDAQKALLDIRAFCVQLDINFDNPKVTEFLSDTYPTTYIEWEERSNMIGCYLTKKEKLHLWKTHRHSLIDFYREFCEKMETMIEQAKQCGDQFITFVGP